MAHFAKIEDGLVVRCIVINNPDTTDADGNEVEAIGQEFIASLRLEGRWLRTSYNTMGGTHKGGKEPFRGNYAGIGMSYNEELDVFHSVQPYPSWNLNTETYQWDSPVPYPEDAGDEMYIWNEENLVWEPYVAPETE